VGPHDIVVATQRSITDLGLGARAEPLQLRHSSGNLPSKLSLLPFCQGLPGSIAGVAMPLLPIHSRDCGLTGSQPLNMRLKKPAPSSGVPTASHGRMRWTDARLTIA